MHHLCHWMYAYQYDCVCAYIILSESQSATFRILFFSFLSASFLLFVCIWSLIRVQTCLLQWTWEEYASQDLLNFFSSSCFLHFMHIYQVKRIKSKRKYCNALFTQLAYTFVYTRNNQWHTKLFKIELKELNENIDLLKWQKK